MVDRKLAGPRNLQGIMNILREMMNNRYYYSYQILTMFQLFCWSYLGNACILDHIKLCWSDVDWIRAECQFNCLLFFLFFFLPGIATHNRIIYCKGVTSVISCTSWSIQMKSKSAPWSALLTQACWCTSSIKIKVSELQYIHHDVIECFSSNTIYGLILA